MAQLPLRVRASIRDVYEKQDAPFGILIAAASKDFGFHVDAPLNWPLLWASLEPAFAQRPADFVPTICKLVLAAVEAIQTICVDDDAWADTMIAAVKARTAWSDGALHVFVEVEPALPVAARGVGWVPRVAWVSSARQRGFVLYVSEKAGVGLKAVTVGQLVRGVKGAIERGDEGGAQTGPLPSRATAAAASETAPWVDLGGPSADVFPSLGELQRPEELLEAATPYFCVVRASGAAVSVECSHEKTVVLIADYLEKWMKQNPGAAREPYGRVELTETRIGSSKGYDTVTLKSFRENSGFPASFNAMVPLAILQGRLGYKLLRSDGSTSVLTRERPFV